MCLHTRGGGGGIVSCGVYSTREEFGRGKFRDPCKFQSLHCLTHTLHCQSPQISPGKKIATFLKNELFVRNYPPPNINPPPPPLPSTFCAKPCLDASSPPIPRGLSSMCPVRLRRALWHEQSPGLFGREGRSAWAARSRKWDSCRERDREPGASTALWLIR